MNTKEEILAYLRSQVPRSHFEEVKSVIPIAFEKAHGAALDLVHIPQDRKRAQDRYSYLQDGLAGLQEQWASRVVPTEPKGEFYTLLNTESVRLTAAVKPWKKAIRPAKYRLNNSRLNKFLISPQLELLGEGQPIFPSEKVLNAIIIPVAPPRHMDQAKPLDIILAVPYFNSCLDYHVWHRLDDFIDGYENVDSSPVDLAWPTLRDRMRHAENLDEEGSNE
jgi:hypothetical protein